MPAAADGAGVVELPLETETETEVLVLVLPPAVAVGVPPVVVEEQTTEEGRLVWNSAPSVSFLGKDGLRSCGTYNSDEFAVVLSEGCGLLLIVCITS